MTTMKSHISHGGLPARLTAPVQRSIRQIYLRHRYNRLLDLDDHILDDIGVTRDEVVYGSRLPLARNAALELRRISEARRRRERISAR